jgi:hypothetical protein
VRRQGGAGLQVVHDLKLVHDEADEHAETDADEGEAGEPDCGLVEKVWQDSRDQPRSC